MKITFTCGKCGKEFHNMPKTNRLGDKVQCPGCKEWQTFKGSMQIIQQNGKNPMALHKA